MRFEITQPCKDCPFRNDVAFYLHKHRRQEIAASLLFADQTFACHKTVDYWRWDDDQAENEDAEYIHSGDEQHCAGALIVLVKQGALWDNKMPRIAKMIGIFDETKLNVDAPVFDTMQAFVEADS